MRLISTKSPLVLPAIGLSCGIIAQDRLNLPIFLPAGLIVLSFAVSLVSLRFAAGQKKLTVIAVATCIAFACVGMIRLAGLYRYPPSHINTLAPPDKSIATLRGTIVTEPIVKDKNSWRFGKYFRNPPSGSFYLKLTGIQTHAGWEKLTGTIITYCPASSVSPASGVSPASSTIAATTNAQSPATEVLQIGDYIQIHCRLEGFKPAANPGQFDVKKYLRTKRILLAATVETTDGITVLGHTKTAGFAAIKNKFRAIVTALAIDQNLSDPQSSAMVGALVLGLRSELDQQTYRAFRTTGLAHFVSLSGQNIAIFAAVFWFLLSSCGCSKRTGAAVCALLTALYLLAVPPYPPALRAGCMAEFIFISILVRRRVNVFNSLALSAIVLLIFDPTDIFNVGWQLSYSTVLGIMLFYNNIYQGIITNIPGHTHLATSAGPSYIQLPAGLAKASLQILATGLAAWLGGAGIMLWHFKTIVPLSTLWTVLTSPLVFIIMAGGFIKIILAFVFPTISTLLGIAAVKCSALLIAIVKYIAALNISEFIIGHVPVLLIILYYITIAVFRGGIVRKTTPGKIMGILLLIGLVGGFAFTKYRRQFDSNLRISCLSAGAGQAIHIACPNGGNILLDAGSSNIQDIGRKVVIPFLRYNGISKIDAIVLSNPKVDHINAVPEIIDEYKNTPIYANPSFVLKAQTLSSAGYLQSCLAQQSVSITTLPAAKTPLTMLSKSCDITLLWPLPEDDYYNQLSENDRSSVFLIGFAGRKILICSDLETDLAQRRLLEKYPALHPDVMVLPRHGSSKKLSDAFIGQLSPRCVISNCSPSQHQYAYKPAPNQSAFYTDTDGAVTVTIGKDGSLSVKSYLKDQTKRL